MEFEVPMWNQIYTMLLNLAVNINKSGFGPELMLGLFRGGWIPARILADLLDNPDLASVGVELYSGVSRAVVRPASTHPVSISVEKRKVLVEDEVGDTGKSLKLVRQHLAEQRPEKVRATAVYIKPRSIVKPDYWEKVTRKWIVFPWEIKETIRKIIQQTREKAKSEESIMQLIKCEHQPNWSERS